MEVTLKYIQFHRFINRGFLIGPYCPIYGYGAVFVTVTVGAFSRVESSYGATFLIAMVVCGVLEYFVSFYMEKVFHARWWDYSTKPMNLNGRVWIGNLILFGLGGTVIVKVADPILFHAFAEIPEKLQYFLAGLIIVIMVTDNTVSHFIMKFVKSSVENSDADDTETISKEVHYLLTNKSVLHKRIADAYPNVVYKTEKIAKKMQEVKTEMDRMKEEAATRIETVEDRIQETKQNIAETVEDRIQERKQNFAEIVENNSAGIRDDIIRKQEELIALLEGGETDQERLTRVHSAIEDRKKQLKAKLLKNK